METPASPPPDSTRPLILSAEFSQLTVDNRHLEIEHEGVPLASLFLQLPSNVILRISRHLDLSEKTSLLVTCQHFRQVLEPIVYKHLRPDGDWKTWRRLRLFKTLQEREHLLSYIRSFRGLLIPTNDSRPYEPSEEAFLHQGSRKELIRREWLAIAAPLYAQAINIRDLQFTDYMGWLPNGNWEIFKNMISNMKLDRLAFTSCADALLDFTPLLRGQPELTKLELYCFPARLKGLEDTAVPNLTFFKGTLKQAAAIVPGRPVERLEAVCPCIVKCECLDEDVYQKLSRSSRAISTLKLHPHSYFKEHTIRGMIQLAVRYLPGILELTILAETSLSVQMLLEEIPKFRSIRSLILLNVFLEFPEPPTCTWLPCLEFATRKVKEFGDFAKRLNALRSSLTDVRYTPLKSYETEDLPISSSSNLQEFL